MRVRFWGTRGSIPKPGPATVRYGGNTSCTEVRARDGTLVVLDCGTGAHELARHLRTQPRAPAGSQLRAPAGEHLLIGHTHWDHIQGFPFFDPLFQTEGAWQVYAPGDRADRLEATFASQMSYEFHPVALGDTRAAVQFHALREGRFAVGGIGVTAQYLHHPALTLGYRLEADGAALVYASDHEPHALPGPVAPPGAAPLHLEDQRHVQFLTGADLVIHDAQYLLSEFPVRRGWGHTPVECAVDYAVAAGARRLALFHHDPERSDDEVDRLVDVACARAARAGSELEVFAAAEGQELELGGHAGAEREPEAHGASALFAPEPPRRRTVLLAEDDPQMARRLRESLLAEGLRLVEVADLASALEAARRDPPSLVLLDLDLPRPQLLEACRALRASADPRLRELPLLVVDGSAATGQDVVEVFEAGATDYLARPIKVTLLRARVRGWLLRAHPG
jgi:phosphoribosyl 1,2-cyclic phosphodiesterase/CheY-like chemotaxis protein